QEDLDLVLRIAPRATMDMSRFAGPVRSWQEGVGDDLVPGQSVMLQRLIEDQCLVGVQPALHLFLRRTEPFEFALPPLVLGFAGLEGLLMLLFLFREVPPLTAAVSPQGVRDVAGHSVE